MLQFVFKFALMLAALGAQAQTMVTSAIGVDAWGTSDGPARYLPNYSIKPAEWRPLNLWANATVKHESQLGSIQVATTAQGIYDPMNGGHIYRLDVDMHNPDGFGARLGVVPYRMTWCRTYDQGTPWIAEPDVFCRFSGLSEMNQSAAGAQAYATVDVAGWALDTLVGEYRPQIYGGDKTLLGPFFAIGPTTSHTKRGAAFNALHLASGAQIRAGVLRSAQDQARDPPTWLRQLRYDSYYFGAESNIAHGLSLRLSLSAYVGDQTNNAAGGAFAFDGRSTTLESTFIPASGHTLAMGLSRYTNTTIYRNYAGVQRLAVPSFMTSYRRDFSGGWYVIAQIMRTTDQFNPIAGPQVNRQGNAVGLRLARVF